MRGRGHERAHEHDGNLPHLVRELNPDSVQARQFEVEIWKKYSLPAACVIFVLIGVPLAVRYHRGGISMVVGVSFLVFTAYYVALIGGESIADQELLSPFWAMWAPNVLFLAVGVAAFYHSRRAGG